MDRDQILSNVKSRKILVGEMEKANINKSCWISNIIFVILAAALMITLGAMGNLAGLYAIAFIVKSLRARSFLISLTKITFSGRLLSKYSPSILQRLISIL